MKLLKWFYRSTGSRV